MGQLSSTARSFGPGAVGADGRRVDERPYPGPGGRAEHPRAPVHVDRAHQPLVAGRLDQPGEVHNGVGAVEVRPQRCAGHVRRPPLHLRERRLRYAPAQAQHRIHGRLRGERSQHARADVPAGARYDDSHACTAGASPPRRARGCLPRARCVPATRATSPRAAAPRPSPWLRPRSQRWRSRSPLACLWATRQTAFESPVTIWARWPSTTITTTRRGRAAGAWAWRWR